MSGFVLSRRAALAGVGGFAVAGLRARPAKAATTLRMWNFLDPVKGKSVREVTLKKLIGNFEAANPGVTILVEAQNWETMSEKFLAAHQTGNAPDLPVIISSRLYGAIKLGSLTNLDDLFVGKWSKEDLADIDGPFWRFGARPGAHYQVASSTTIYGQLYRTDLFKQAGIDPDALTTWDQFHAALPKLQQKDATGATTRWAFGQPNSGLTPAAPLLLSVLLEQDGRIFDDKLRAAWSTPAGVRGLTMETDMIRKDGTMPDVEVSTGNEAVHEQFLAGRIAVMRISPARWLQVVAKFGPGSVGYLPTPSYTEGKQSPSEVTAWHMGVWSGSKNQELAGKFVEYMASREADSLWTTMAGQPPARQSTIAANAAFFADPANALLPKFAADIRNNGWLAPDGAGEGGWNEGFCAAFQDVITNNVDPKAALEKAETAFNRTHHR